MKGGSGGGLGVQMGDSRNRGGRRWWSLQGMVPLGEVGVGRGGRLCWLVGVYLVDVWSEGLGSGKHGVGAEECCRRGWR